MDVRLNILTYNRPELLLEVIQRLDANVELVVFDDASTADYTKTHGVVRARGGRIVRASENHGKPRFGEWLDVVHQDALESPARIFISLPDDMLPCRSFIERAIQLWDSIQDTRKLALNLHRDQRTSCWHSGEATDCGAVLKTGWIDGAFLCEARYYNMIARRQWTVQRDWQAQPQLGSGVYQRISMFARLRNQRLYGVKRSLLRHVGGESKMNPEARQVHTLETVDFIDDAAC